MPALLGALAQASNAILIAPPGAGKTTLVPLALLDATWATNQRIVMLEPRRLAAEAAARRMASLLGETVGRTVGFRTRLASAMSIQTRIEVVTEGLLVRRLQSDPGLDGTAAVIFDEIHERTLDSDLALAFTLDLQRELRPELRLLAMSATPDIPRLRALLAAPVIESEGRMHPVAIHHSPRDIADPRDLPAAAARATRNALSQHEGDILVFLPGMAEIRRTEAALAEVTALVLPLHGELSPEIQERALRPDPDHRRIVLATSIAETSLTIPGVRIVIDGGFRRAPRLDPASGLAKLATLRISRAAADQRAGRAGREAPGIAIRLWSEALHRGLALFERPEIAEADLAGLVLDCAAWGAAPADLPFPDQPAEGGLKAARTLLAALGALDQAGKLTAHGRAMSRLGAHPRLAAMMLAARDQPERALAADLAALLEERDPLRARDAPADIGLRLDAIAGGAADADRVTLSRIRRGADQYRARLQAGRGEARGNPARLIAAAFPDRIAQSRGEPGSFRLAGGGGARLDRNDPLATARFLAVAALELKQAARIRLAVSLSLEDLPQSVTASITTQVETGLDPVTGSVLARRRRRLGALILEDRTEPASEAETAEALARAACADPERLPWTDDARQFQARVALARSYDPDFPDLSDQAVQRDGAVWLAPHLLGMTRLAHLADLDLFKLLRAQLSWEQAARLDRDLPADLSLPRGRAAIDYREPVPLASARAQHFYGLAASPQLAQGRVPLRIALLSPAGRPIAITADLGSFWRGAWLDARKDMRGRYPKHDWPEFPGVG